MNSPRTVTVSEDNFHSQIETLLRTFGEVKDWEDVALLSFIKEKDKYILTIHTKEVQNQITVH